MCCSGRGWFYCHSADPDWNFRKTSKFILRVWGSSWFLRYNWNFNFNLNIIMLQFPAKDNLFCIQDTKNKNKTKQTKKAIKMKEMALNLYVQIIDLCLYFMMYDWSGDFKLAPCTWKSDTLSFFWRSFVERSFCLVGGKSKTDLAQRS